MRGMGHNCQTWLLNRLDIRADWNLMESKKIKGKVLHIRETANYAVMQAGGWLPGKQIHRK